MARPRRSITCPREPIALSLEEAAAFVGMSATHFLRLMNEGVMPHPRRAGGRRLWDAEECIAAFRRLPREGGMSDPSEADPYSADRICA